MAHDAIVTPLDVVKQRLQVYNSSYAGVLQCIRRVAAEEGLKAFYASYPTTVAMNVPFQAVHFAAYESIKLFIGDGQKMSQYMATRWHYFRAFSHSLYHFFSFFS